MTDLFSTYGVSPTGKLLSVAALIPLTMVVGFIGLKLRDEMSEAGPLQQMDETKGGRRMSDLKSQTAVMANADA